MPDWQTAHVEPLPGGGGEVKIEVLDETTVAMTISGQRTVLQNFPIGETLEMRVAGHTTVGESIPIANANIHRASYDKFIITEG